MSLKIDVGCGLVPREGYIGIDPYITQHGIVNAFMWELPFEDDTVDAIYSSHALEHIGKDQVMPTLLEWFRVLRPGGDLELLVPDLEWCVNHWLKHKHSRGWELDIIFGNQNHEGEYHKTGFTHVTLSSLLTKAGFSVAAIDTIGTHGQQTLRARAHACK